MFDLEKQDEIGQHLKENFWDLEDAIDDTESFTMEKKGYEVVDFGQELHTEWGGQTEIIIRFEGKLHMYTFTRDSWNGEHSIEYNWLVTPVEVTRIEYMRAKNEV